MTRFGRMKALSLAIASLTTVSVIACSKSSVPNKGQDKAKTTVTTTTNPSIESFFSKVRDALKSEASLSATGAEHVVSSGVKAAQAKGIATSTSNILEFVPPFVVGAIGSTADSETGISSTAQRSKAIKAIVAAAYLIPTTGLTAAKLESYSTEMAAGVSAALKKIGADSSTIGEAAGVLVSSSATLTNDPQAVQVATKAFVKELVTASSGETEEVVSSRVSAAISGAIKKTAELYTSSGKSTDELAEVTGAITSGSVLAIVPSSTLPSDTDDLATIVSNVMNGLTSANVSPTVLAAVSADVLSESIAEFQSITGTTSDNLGYLIQAASGEISEVLISSGVSSTEASVAVSAGVAGIAAARAGTSSSGSQSVDAVSAASVTVQGGGSAYKSSTLVCEYTAASTHSSSTTYTYAWYKNGTAISGQTSTSLSGQFSKSDAIKCGVVASSNGVSSSETLSSEITVSNSAPTAPTVSVSVSGGGSPIMSSTFSCSASDSTDADGDTISYVYIWYKNGTAISGATAQTLTGGVAKLDVITCAASAGDSDALSSTVTSSNSQTILNSTPTVPSSITVSVSGGGTAYKSSTLVCGYTASSDLDSDTITYRFKWFLNGSTTAISGATSSTLSGAFVKTNTVKCSVAADDGTTTTSYVDSSNLQTISNSSPTVSCTNKTQSLESGASPSPAIVCSGTDIDSDTISYSISNGCAGLAIADSTVGNVSGTMGGSNCSSTVTASDGTGSGTDTITLTWLPPSLTVSSANASITTAGTYYNITVSGGYTLTISGGITVTVQNKVTVTGAGSTILVNSINNTAQVSGQWVGEGSTIDAKEIQVDSGAKISANGTGYVGGAQNTAGVGPAPGGGVCCYGAGGGYGGTGGNGDAAGGSKSDITSSLAPTALGSSGSGGNNAAGGGAGGGSLRLIVSDLLTLNGTIEANGSDGGTAGGGGSGGSVRVTTSTLTGSGYFTAKGGAGGAGGGGGGGGGRIAVTYATDSSFGGFTTSTAVGGAGVSGYGSGGTGTVAFLHSAVTNNHLKVYEYFQTDTDQAFTIGALTVLDAATFDLLGGSSVTASGTVTVTENSFIEVYSKNTTSASGGVGATISAANLTVDSGSKVRANSTGYLGGDSFNGGYGPGGHGAACCEGSGGGHGGTGGAASQGEGASYDSATAPTDLGSGGGGGNNGSRAGAGGGAIRVTLTGTLTLSGTIEANGGSSSVVSAGGGAGGSIYVTCSTLTGNGSFNANGGNGGSSNGGGGGGGRIAVYFASESFGGFTTSTATGGAKLAGTGANGGDGSVVFFDTSVTNNHLRIYKSLVIAEDQTPTYGAVTLTDATLTVGGGSTITVNGAVTLSGTSTLLLKGKNTSAQVAAAWAGDGVTLNAASMTVSANSVVSANEQGYKGGLGGMSDGKGPQGGSGTCCTGAGGGHGGAGGNASGVGGSTYGSDTAPSTLGSGGGGGNNGSALGGSGGGEIRIALTGNLSLSGTISANGGNGPVAPDGGGAGGSIYISVSDISGTGTISANGGNGGSSSGGGGGGGRIAVYYLTNASDSTTKTKTGGTGTGGAANGTDGTLVYVQGSPPP